MKKITKRQEMKARAIVQAAMNQQKAADLDEKLKLIGRCFKYPNSYSDGERWWLYAVVTGVDDDGRLSVIQFQATTSGERSIHVGGYPGLLPNGGWVPITEAEFKAGTYEFFSSVCQALGTATKVAAVDPHVASTGTLSTREKD